MDETKRQGRMDGRERASGDEEPSWSERVSELSASGGGEGSSEVDSVSVSERVAGDGLLEEGLGRLQEYARQAARSDARAGVPGSDDTRPTEHERSLRERCRTLFDRWSRAQRKRLREELAEHEERVSRYLGRAGLLLDRFDRLINELIRLKARRSTHEQDLRSRSPVERERPGQRSGISTKVYILAIGFLGVVEFFANAPVFSTLLPRDPLTERQIGVISETSTGWMAGFERVLAQIVLRPDAALLAAGVVTFLCVLAHFFGHSLRDLVARTDKSGRQEAGAGRPAMENVVPMILTCLGLVFVLGVLFQARVILGEVGEVRYQQDMEAVSELRREAGWLRTDGELLQANQLADQADDMEQAAIRLREYAESMARMTFPILLLNMTLVLAAVTAAYFHRRTDARGGLERDPYSGDREGIVAGAEETASEIDTLLSRARRSIRELDGLSGDGIASDSASVARQLESIVSLYRRENAQAQGVRPDNLAAFRSPVDLSLDSRDDGSGLDSFRRAAADAEAEHKELGHRFREARGRFNDQLRSWGSAADDV